MSNFNAIYHSLRKGVGVRRGHWAPEVRIFVENNALMYHSGIQKPWRCALSWEEIAATDWMLLNGEPVEQTLEGLSIAAPIGNSLFNLSGSRVLTLTSQDISDLLARLHSDPDLLRSKDTFES